MQNRAMNPETIAPPMGAYSHGVEITAGSRILYIAGQVGAAPDGSVPKDIKSQAENAWTNCQRILEFNGMRIKDLVKVNHFLVNSSDIAAYNQVRMKFLGETRPASTLIIVKELFKPEFLVEVEMVAALK